MTWVAERRPKCLCVDWAGEIVVVCQSCNLFIWLVADLSAPFFPGAAELWHHPALAYSAELPGAALQHAALVHPALHPQVPVRSYLWLGDEKPQETHVSPVAQGQFFNGTYNHPAAPACSELGTTQPRSINSRVCLILSWDRQPWWRQIRLIWELERQSLWLASVMSSWDLTLSHSNAVVCVQSL